MIYSKFQLWDTECCNSDMLKFNPLNGLRGIRMLKNRVGFLIHWIACKVYKAQKI